jgi:hypothetical protein
VQKKKIILLIQANPSTLLWLYRQVDTFLLINKRQHPNCTVSFTVGHKHVYRLAAPGNRIILRKGNIVYRRYIMSPALSTLLSSWACMMAKRSDPASCSRCSSHCVGTGAQTQGLLNRWPWTIKCLLFCSKLLLHTFLLLKNKPQWKKKMFMTFSYFFLCRWKAFG